MKRGQGSTCITKSFRANRNSSGQALVEYALLLSISVGLSISLVKFFNETISQGTLRFGAQLEKELRSGGFPEAPNLWGEE